MPATSRPFRQCTHPGCMRLTAASRCDKHRYAEEKAAAQGPGFRGTASERGYDARWVMARRNFLRLHPLCQCPDCQEGKVRLTTAIVVDHKIPHKENMDLFWDQSNWQSMTKPCHDRKTALEDGGFGRPRRDV